ncbi:SPOR domain-containing protein [Guyparkeria hydrothermalis]|uniref:SPOR domain-containing protein n=1 Tax=Guyparkeria hydrothermalis TaxID=923 RepID=UPI0020200E19|nr:SPOR domain-containing protein [Guyparkeria hydrothermalis]MCL7745315.1 SPOR domain-containing protein [Guyparkeria hydrothermalis]
MTDATDHALEQAERIVQYAKYSDRFMVVEGDSAAERRAFVKLIGQKLPRQVRPVVLRADAGNGAGALIEQLSTLLQLSAGIETIEQLITAATAALDGQDRLLIVVENADHWLESDGADALFELINQAHDLARERLLFLLIGATGLCEQIETAQPLAGLVADLHCAQLLGTARRHETGTATTAPAAAAAQAESTPSTPETHAAPNHATTHPARRSPWASPTLLIAVIVSIAVISVGAFALLDRSGAPATKSTDLAVDPSENKQAEQPANDAAEPATSESSEAPAEAATNESSDDDGQTEPAATPELSGIDHGLPPHVPFPDEQAAQDESMDEPASTKQATDETTDGEAPAEKADPVAAEPVTEEARGEAAATPPASVDNAWYRDQPRARAAIQMAAFGRLDDATGLIERFANDAHPRSDWRIYAQKIDGKILYTVTFGNYASTERARHAIDDLSDELQKLKPYPRSVGAIQDRLTDASP